MSEKDLLKDLDIDRTILKWIVKELDGGMDSIDLAQDRDRWRTVVNAVMSFRVP